jgi:hypothetical protein
MNRHTEDTLRASLLEGDELIERIEFWQAMPVPRFLLHPLLDRLAQRLTFLASWIEGTLNAKGQADAICALLEKVRAKDTAWTAPSVNALHIGVASRPPARLWCADCGCYFESLPHQCFAARKRRATEGPSVR